MTKINIVETEKVWHSSVLDEMVEVALKEVGFEDGVFEFRFQVSRRGLEGDGRFFEVVAKLKESIRSKLTENIDKIGNTWLFSQLEYMTAALTTFGIYPYIYGADTASPVDMAKIYISTVNMGFVKPQESWQMHAVINRLLLKRILVVDKDGRGEYIYPTMAVDGWLK